MRRLLPVVGSRAGRVALMVAAGAAIAGCAGTPTERRPPVARAGVLQHCDALASTFTFPNTRITSASAEATGPVGGGPSVGAHCLVKGTMNERTGAGGTAYAIGFEMRLPREWNGRFWYQGNGGIDGSVVPALGGLGGGPLTSALGQGFAVISSDAGHDNRLTKGPQFGLDPQSRLDYGYQAVSTLTPMAKALITQAYGRGPDTSYIGGCSNGGRHAMVAAARNPQMFDGYLIGAPGYRLPLAAVANMYGAQQYRRVATDPKDLSTAFTLAERRTVAGAVLERCDALDGLRDGMVQDAAACAKAFDLQRDVPTCSAGRNGSCLTGEQKRAVGNIFRGATTRDGRPFYASFPFDAGLATDDFATWEFKAPIERDAGAYGFIFGVPPQDPASFDPMRTALDGDIDAMLAAVNATRPPFTESAMQFMTPPGDVALGPLRAGGARLLLYHGTSDAIFSLDDSKGWIDRANQRSGGDASRMVRLFPVPGMNHCRGGPSTDQFDAISPLVRWVEHGEAPQQIVATARGAGNPGGANGDLPAGWSPARSRPLCPYPAVARYMGGDPEQAASFACR